MAALVALSFAAALGLGAAFAALDVATRRSAGFLLTVLAAIGLVGAMFVFLTQPLHADFKTEVLAISPLAGLIGLFCGYGLGKVGKGAQRAAR